MQVRLDGFGPSSWCRAAIGAGALLAGLAMSPAHADLLQLGGDYGDARGCQFLKTNDYSEETMISLTGDGYQTYVHGCEFVQALRAKNGDRVVTATCSEEGEGGTTIELLRIAKVADADAYELFSQNGDPLGRVDRCPN